MQTLDLALKSYQGQGRKITIPFREVNEVVDFRTGDLALLAGAAGGGKSLTALNWAWRSPDPILYLAQDSPRSVMKRLVALALNRKVSEINEEDAFYWGEQMKGKRPELIITRGSQSIADIEAQVIALTEWLMEPPRIIFIDNLFDLRVEGLTYTENSFYGEVLPSLKQLAIRHDVGIVVMHHVGRSGEHGKKEGSGTEPLKMTSLLFAGEREARHVWGVYRGYDNRTLYFQILKQQDGVADAWGYHRIPLTWNAEDGRLWSR